MAVSTISDFSNVTKPEYDRRVLLFLNQDMPLLNFMNQGKIEKTFQFNGEDYFYFPYQIQLPEGGAWSAENTGIPTALSVDFEQPYLSWKKYVHTIEMSQETLELTKGKPNALKDALKTYMSGALLATKLNIDTAIHGDGTGAVATAVSYSGQVVTVDSTKYIRQGMVLDGYDSDDNHDADGIVVTKVNSETTFTCTGTVTSVDTGTVFYTEGSWVTGLDRAANGIDNIVDDDSGTFQGLSRSTYPEMKAHVTDGDTPGTNQALTIARMRGVCDNILKGRAGVAPDWIYTSIGARNAYYDLMVAKNMPTTNMPTVDGIPGDIVFNYGSKSLPVYGAPRAADNTMFFLSKTGLFKYFGKMGWFDWGGGTLKSLQTAGSSEGAGKLGVRANYYTYMNFGSAFPEKNGRLNDITET